VAIALAQVVKASGNNVTSVTTGTITTGASGSKFLLLAGGNDSGASYSASDSKSNSYSAIGSQQLNGILRQAAFVSEGTGDASHSGTITGGGGEYLTVFFAEVTGAAASAYDSGSLVQNTGAWSATTGTFAQANNLAISFLSAYTDANSAFTESTGNWTIAIQEQDGVTNWPGALGRRTTSATTAVSTTWANAAGASFLCLTAFGLKESAAVSTTGRPLQLPRSMGPIGERTGKRGLIMRALFPPRGMGSPQPAAVDVTATLAVTDATDTLASTTTEQDTASLTATDATDTLSSSVAVLVVANLTATDATDTVSSVAAALVTVNLSATDDTDTLSSTASIAAAGVVASLDATDATDSLTATAAVAVGAALAATDATDALAATAALTVAASLSVADAADTLAASSVSAITAALTATDAQDTLSAATAVLVVASAAATDAADTLAASATTAGPVTVTLAVTDAPDTLSATLTTQEAAPAGHGSEIGGNERRRIREVSVKPILQRVLEARSERRVKPAKERQQKRAKAIEQQAAELVLQQPDASEQRLRELMAQWMAQRPVLPFAASPMDLFLSQIAFRLQQMQALETAAALLQAAEDEDDEDALIALLMA